MIDLVQLFREQVALLHNLNGAPVTRPADPLAITDPVDGFHGTALAAPTPVPGQAASVGAPALTGPAGRPAPHDRSGLPATTPATPLANGTAPPAGAVPAPGGPADQAAGGPVTGSPGVGGRFGGAGAESAADRTGFDLVADLISQVTAYPRDFIQPGHELKNHLGFDSIMMADLVTRARRRWPDLRMDPQMLQSVVTVQDLCGLLPVPAVDGGPVATAGRRAPESTARHQHPADAADVTAFPEVRAVVERGERAESMGIRNPYFLVHDGTIRDTTSIGSRELISFSSYNYLGLSGHPGIAAAISQAVDRYGSSVSAARILSGQRPIHVELDRRIADLTGTQDALTLVSGHATNVSVIGHLLGPGDLVLHDALAHDSIIGGCRLSGAHRQPFPHNDAEAIDALLREVRGRYRRVLIVIEGVYSMDGDIPDLPAIIEVKQRHGALLMIDEAHSIGVLGPHGGGVGEHFGIDRTLVDVWMGTLSKSFASCGGYVAGRRELIEYFRYTLPGFIYSAGMTPANTAAALAALEVMGAEPERLARLRARAGTLFGLLREAGLDTGVAGGATPIVPCVFGDSEQTLKVADLLLQAGVSVNPILYPAVEESAARLRFFVTAEHTPEQLETAAAALVEAARKTSNQPLADTFDSRVAASESRVAASESRVAASP